MTAAVQESQARKAKIKGSSDRSFGYVFVVVFAVVALFPLVRSPHDPATIRWWALGVALAILAIAWLRLSWLAPANRAWMKFGLLLNRVVEPIVLGTMFFVVLTPFALMMRLGGKDPMRKRREPDSDSYWIVHDKSAPVSSMQNQF